MITMIICVYVLYTHILSNPSSILKVTQTLATCAPLYNTAQRSTKLHTAKQPQRLDFELKLHLLRPTLLRPRDCVIYVAI